MRARAHTHGARAPHTPCDALGGEACPPPTHSTHLHNLSHRRPCVRRARGLIGQQREDERHHAGRVVGGHGRCCLTSAIEGVHCPLSTMLGCCKKHLEPRRRIPKE